MQLSSRMFLVWARNRDVYLRTWYVNLLPPLLEPVYYIIGFGLGLGAYLKALPYGGFGEVPYIAFIGPGMVAVTVMFQSSFECMHGSFVRMYYQKTFDAIIATPVSVDEVVAGDMLWATTKAAYGALLVVAVVTFFGYGTDTIPTTAMLGADFGAFPVYPHTLGILLIAVLGGAMFAGLAMCMCAISPSIDFFNLPIFLFLLPQFTFSNTFFPIDQMPAWVGTLAQWLPLYHVSVPMRALAFGQLDGVWSSVIYLVAVTAGSWWLGIRLMRRRLIA